MSKQILILANSAGGLLHFRFELIKRLLNEEYEVWFSLPQTEEDEKVKLMVKAGANYIQTDINRRGINPLEDIKVMKKYQTIIKKVNPDVVLTYTVKPNIYGSIIAKLNKKSVIINITGIGSSLTKGNLKVLVKSLYKIACKKANYVFFQNEYNRSFFIKNNILSSEKTRLIPGSGVNIERFQPLEKEVQDKKIKFLFIGRIEKEKGIEEFLHVAKSVTKKYENTEFQILGNFDGNDYKEIVGNSEGDRIQYLGVSQDVRKEIKEVDCIINPSYHEGMSNVLLEAGGMGKALIASNIPGCKEIIDEGKNGFLFDCKSVDDLEEKVVKFIKSTSEEREKMGRNSRIKVVNEFDRNIVINSYINEINKIINKET